MNDIMNDNNLYGYIYVRDNKWYESENVFKIGISSSIKDRECAYITTEIKRGEFILVIKILLNHMKMVDNMFKCNFKEYNIKFCLSIKNIITCKHCRDALQCVSTKYRSSTGCNF